MAGSSTYYDPTPLVITPFTLAEDTDINAINTAIDNAFGAMNTALAPTSEILTTDETIVVDGSRATFFLGKSTTGSFVVTLPAPAIGLQIRFIISDITSATVPSITTNSSANIIYGQVLLGSSYAVATEEDTISFTFTTASMGNIVDLESDGTNWYVSGQSHAIGITFSAT